MTRFGGLNRRLPAPTPHPIPCICHCQAPSKRSKKSFAGSCAHDPANGGGQAVQPLVARGRGRARPPSAGSLNPNSRLGTSPHWQGRVMEQESMYVGIDVSKDRLDVALLPAGESLAVGRDSAGLEDLTGRLHRLSPALIVL